MPRKQTDLSKAKIYRLVSLSMDKQYIGSTCDDLRKRFSRYKANYKSWQNGKYAHMTAFDVLCYEDVEIYLIEMPECKTLDELHRRKGQIIEETNCVNKVKPHTTCKHDLQRDYCRECSGFHICIHNERRSYCYDCGGSAVQTIICECGTEMRKVSKNRHIKTQKHIDWEANNDQQPVE